MLRKLTAIIVIGFVAVLAIVLTIVSLISYRIFFDFTSDEISATKLTLLNENADKLAGISHNVSQAGYYLAANDTVIQTFTDPVVDSFDAIKEQRELRNQMNIMAGLKPEIHSLEMYTDRYNGFPIISDGHVLPLEELEKQSWFSIFEHMDSGWIPWRAHGRNMVSFIHRLVDYRGSKVGYIKVNLLEERFFSELTIDGHVDPLSEPLLLVDTGGRVIARTQAAESGTLLRQLTVADADEPYDRLQDTFMHLSDYHQVLMDGSERYLLLISKPNSERWRLVQLIPVKALYAETTKLGWIVLSLGILVLLLSIPLVYWLGKKIILVPIHQIIFGMKQVERGKFDVRLDPLYIEEFDYLAQHFNRMTSELEQSIKQINSEHRARRDAELKMLQNQIMPHFLYNTLDIIHWKAMDYKAEEISLMVNSLSKMFRIGLSGGRSFIRLRDELEHVNRYIDIQRARMADRQIEYTAHVPATLKDYYVPKIILQPFIENSMKHGYADKVMEVVRISVAVEAIEDTLVITITDEGSGLPEEWTLAQSTGIGIKNVQERIWMYCGKSYGIELSNRPEGGAAVVIRLPILRNQEEVEACLAKNSEGFDGM